MPRPVLSADALKALIASPLVPAHPTGYWVPLGAHRACIKKPYVDEDGDDMGNCLALYRDEDDTLVLASLDMEEGGAEVFSIIYIEGGEGEWQPMTELDAPADVREFAGRTWAAVAEVVEREEQEARQFEHELQARLAPRAVPALLRQLAAFERWTGRENFSECFYLRLPERASLRGWSEAPRFLDAFAEFACATGSGSSYAFWLLHDDLLRCPIVVFGDEGGIFVVAENLPELLRLLALDAEVSVDVGQRAYFWRDEEAAEDDEDEDDEGGESPYHAEYVEWLQTQQGLTPVRSVAEADALTQAAQAAHQTQLDAFLTEFGIDNRF